MVTPNLHPFKSPPWTACFKDTQSCETLFCLSSSGLQRRQTLVRTQDGGNKREADTSMLERVEEKKGGQSRNLRGIHHPISRPHSTSSSNPRPPVPCSFLSFTLRLLQAHTRSSQHCCGLLPIPLPSNRDPEGEEVSGTEGVRNVPKVTQLQ